MFSSLVMDERTTRQVEITMPPASLHRNSAVTLYC